MQMDLDRNGDAHTHLDDLVNGSGPPLPGRGGAG